MCKDFKDVCIKYPKDLAYVVECAKVVLLKSLVKDGYIDGVLYDNLMDSYRIGVVYNKDGIFFKGIYYNANNDNIKIIEKTDTKLVLIKGGKQK